MYGGQGGVLGAGSTGTGAGAGSGFRIGYMSGAFGVE
jgi:hypothetical protein